MLDGAAPPPIAASNGVGALERAGVAAGPTVAYSESRVRRLQYCARSYYFRYGKLSDVASAADATPATVLRLRRTTTLPAAVGAVLHDAAVACARAAAGGAAAPPPTVLQRTAAETLNRLWRASGGGRDPALIPGAGARVLQELLYGDVAVGPALDRARARLACGIAALDALSPLWRYIRDRRAEVRVPPRFLRFRLAGAPMPCYAAPDLLLRPLPNGIHWIVEFKSGRIDGAVDQVLAYGVAARDGLRLAPASAEVAYRGLVVALGAPAGAPAGGRTTRIPISHDDLREAEARIRDGMDRIRAAEDAQHPSLRNRPELPPMPADVGRCRGCEFRALCYPGAHVLPSTRVAGCS